ncbi:MAG: glycogen debranching enzyme GlgX, partial [Intrasporangiaceae bacterium]|nr:glycogen debranching enzyme GlgX [Intrasporangiaceae bacterium]
FLIAVRTDPVLSRVKLIAEPWDLGPGGWRTGQFPPPFLEWNDRFRDATRTFWLSDVRAARHGHAGHGVRDLATRLAGSQDLFHTSDRGPLASVNFVAAHDGFTVADLTAYNRKHNGANGEGNRDGTDDNRSYNHGQEGWADASEATLAARRRSIRNLLATLLVSAGVPMINAGDEFGRSQWGNNNPYCLDIEDIWFDWDLADWQQDLLDTTSFLVALRREHPVLRQRTFFTGHTVDEDGSVDVAWFGGHGRELTQGEWESGATHTLSMLLDGAWIGTHSVLIVLHGAADEGAVTLPAAPGLRGYSLLWDSTWETPHEQRPESEPAPPATEITMGAASLRIYRVADPT